MSSLEEDYGSIESEDMSTSTDTSCRSSADADKNFDIEEDFRKKLNQFDDIIEQIENLQLSRDNVNDDNENVGRTQRVKSNKLYNAKYQDSCELQTSQHLEDLNNNENDSKVDDNEGCLPLNICKKSSDEKRHRSMDGLNNLNDDSETERERRHDKESNDSGLIERGPIKPDYQPTRGHPYSMVSWLMRANDCADISHSVDYDKTAEQILRNKDYSEKLTPCLDQLTNSNRNQTTISAIICENPDLVWTGENGNIFRNENFSTDVSPLNYHYRRKLIVTQHHSNDFNHIIDNM